MTTDTARNANAFASTFLFFFNAQANRRKNKKELASKRTRQCKDWCGLDTTSDEREERTHNKGYTTMRGSVLRMTVLCKVEYLCFVLKFSGNNPALRVAQNR